MKKKLVLCLSFCLVLFFVPLVSKADTLGDRLKGRIVLQVEAHGEAWYVSPSDKLRYYLGRPDDAFRLMRELGLGISSSDYERYKNNAPASLLGKIVIKVHDKGQAYYVNPVNRKMHYLGRPNDAFNVMRELGLGISNDDLERIAVNKSYTTTPYSRHEIMVTDNSATPSEISVAEGSDIEIEFKASRYGFARGGVELRSSNGMGNEFVLWAGESKIVSYQVAKQFSVVPYYPNSNIKLPYVVSVNIK